MIWYIYGLICVAATDFSDNYISIIASQPLNLALVCSLIHITNRRQHKLGL